ncbi:hypothetical protein DH09_13860 [Bacillaceae bacterium JMAK1]|nr:hypothetical protein DH09_13860 [Bacillaceae bacterium JMAK1]
MNNTRSKLIFWQVFAYIGLNIAYYIISSEFYYMGFEFEPDILYLLLGTILFVLLLIIGFAIKDSFIFSIYNILLIYWLAGEVIFFIYNPDSYFILPLIIFFLLILLIGISFVNVKLGPTKTFKNPNRKLSVLAVIMFVPFLISYYRYIDLRNLLFVDVYETREVFRGVGNVVTGYMNAPLSRVVLPVLIIINILKKNYKLTILFSLMILYIYLSGALKSVFLGLILLFFFYTGDLISKSLRFIKLVSFLTVGGSTLFFFTGNIFLLDAFTRRVFFTPAYLNNRYIEYFQDNFTYLAHSPFGFNLVVNRYSDLDLSLSRYFGEVVMATSGLNANVGVLTEGYLSFGIIGGLLTAFVIALIIYYFKFIDLDQRFFGIVFVFIYYFYTSFFSTLLLTHGLLFFMIISVFFLRKGMIKG